MAARKKTWQEKLTSDKGLPRVVDVPQDNRFHSGAGRMLIPAPLQVDALMRQVPRGQVTTINELRAALAERHGADFACPITTGIFAWIAAHAAEEAAAAGAKRFTPYWRTLKTGGEINPKYPGGMESVVERLRSEGHTVTVRGKRTFLDFLETNLFRGFQDR
jgi:alkylated DNA nucleotide flippase Atl1